MATYSEVIYCKNCKYCEREIDDKNREFLLCTKHSRYNNEVWVGYFDFCSWAKYKEEKK